MKRMTISAMEGEGLFIEREELIDGAWVNVYTAISAAIIADPDRMPWPRMIPDWPGPSQTIGFVNFQIIHRR